MFCKNCGSEISDQSVVCPKCGVQVGELKPAATENQTDDRKTLAPNAVGLVGFILAMVGVVFWIVGFASLFLFIVPVFLCIAAIVCSALGMKKSANGQAQFHGLSIAGLVVGIIVTSAAMIQLIAGIVMLYVLF